MLVSTPIQGLPIYGSLDDIGDGMMGGSGDGIVAVAGAPASKPVYLFKVYNDTIQQLAMQRSTPKGRYIFRALNADNKYMVMVRDDNKGYEPFAWDWITPDTTLTPSEQLALALEWFG